MIENEKRPREGLEQQRSAEKGLNEKGLKAEKPKKVLVELKELDPGFWGYDVQILDEASTVQDYLEEPMYMARNSPMVIIRRNVLPLKVLFSFRRCFIRNFPLPPSVFF